MVNYGLKLVPRGEMWIKVGKSGRKQWKTCQMLSGKK